MGAEVGTLRARQRCFCNRVVLSAIEVVCVRLRVVLLIFESAWRGCGSRTPTIFPEPLRVPFELVFSLHHIPIQFS